MGQQHLAQPALVPRCGCRRRRVSGQSEDLSDPGDRLDVPVGPGHRAHHGASTGNGGRRGDGGVEVKGVDDRHLRRHLGEFVDRPVRQQYDIETELARGIETRVGLEWRRPGVNEQDGRRHRRLLSG